MTEEQAEEIAWAVRDIALSAAQSVAFGWDQDREPRQRLIKALVSSSLPNVGTPEYEPTAPQPTRLSGGAN